MGCRLSAWNVGLSVEVCSVPIFSVVQLYTLQGNHLTGAKGLVRLPDIYCSIIHLQTQEIFSLFPLPSRCGNLLLHSSVVSLISYTCLFPPPPPYFLTILVVIFTNKEWLLVFNEDPDTLFGTEASYQEAWKLVSIFKMKTNTRVQMASLKNGIYDNF